MGICKSLLVLLLGCILMTGYSQTTDNRYELVVAQDGSGDHSTIQAAVNAVRDHAERRVVIHIKAGVYEEKVVIPSFKRNITLRGEDRDRTIIRYDDYSGKPYKGIDVTGNPDYSTYTSYTLLLAANDCNVENLTIENTAGRVGQAVALHTEGDRVVVLNCVISGNQDTLYLAKGGTRNYFGNCVIKGTTDFIFGAATVYFKDCIVESLANSYITAASTTQEESYGFVFVDCRLVASGVEVNKVYLGRPWRPYAKTVFIRTALDKHIVPEGWHSWPGDKNFPNKEKTAYYAEYDSYGEGASDLSKRVVWSRQLRKKDLKKYQQEKVLRGWKPVLE